MIALVFQSERPKLKWKFSSDNLPKLTSNFRLAPNQVRKCSKSHEWEEQIDGGKLFKCLLETEKENYEFGQKVNNLRIYKRSYPNRG